jgi:glycosyltransferase involved in cell wall biosynthesis
MVAVSIILPCYNQEKYIAECLDSVLAQSFRDYEVIVVNDGSTDKSAEIVHTYMQGDSRITLIEQSNQGVVSARNNALQIAKGEYIYPLDGDDKISPICLEKLYQAAQEGKGDVIFSQVQFLGDKECMFHLPEPNKMNMFQGNCVVCSALYRKSDALRYGGYDPNMEAGYEDWEFWWNFLDENKKFYRLDAVLFYYRLSKGSRSEGISAETMQKLIRYIRRKHVGGFDKDIKFELASMLYKIKRFLYQNVITSHGKRLIKICKIPIWDKKIKL